MSKKLNELLVFKEKKLLHSVRYKNFFRGCNFLLIVVAFLSSTILSSTSLTSNVEKTEISGDWTKINNKWPLKASEFFITVTKKHSFIDIELPDALEHDLSVRLVYFYNYKRVKPIVQVVPCTTNENIINETISEPEGQWLAHTMLINKTNCASRHELTYNVILHDDGDIFAWRLLEIKKVGGEITQAPPSISENPMTAAPTTAAPATEGLTSEPPVSEGSSTTASATDGSSQAPPESWVSTSEAPVSEGSSTSTSATEGPTTEGSSQAPPESSASTSEAPVFEGSSTKPPAPEWSATDSSTTLPDKFPPATPETSEAPATEAPESPRHSRRKRAPESKTFELTCKPSSCNRDLIVTKNFLPMIKGVPQLPWPFKELSDKKSYYVGTSSKPIDFSSTSFEDLTDVNTCLDLQLYMEPGTVMEFSVEDDTVTNRKRLLELIDTRAHDSRSNHWTRFKRCIDNYMPKLRASSGDKHKIRFTFLPKNMTGGKQVALFADNRTAISLKALYKPISYIRNIDLNTNEEKFNQFWVLNEEKNESPFELAFNDQPSTSTQVLKPKVSINYINPNQETFDITSRWLKVEDIDTLENQMILNYEADKADWFDSFSLQCQSMADPEGKWLNITEYSRQSQSDKEKAPIPLIEEQQENRIIVKGLTADEFRIRARYYISKKATDQNKSLTLSLNKLAFGDLCANNSYCLNDGICEPTGPAKATCKCPSGFSGERCESIKPCDVIYGQQTGEQLCRSIGAKCINGLPVYRCIWPNDTYFDCKPLFAHRYDEETGELTPLPGPKPDGAVDSNPSAPLPLTEQVSQLQEQASSQAQLIIILAVLMISMLLFLVVIVINLINRLMKSKRALKEAQSEVHELTRRSLPPVASGSGLARNNARHRPSGTITYNNQAFDAD